ncbi:MAG: hypothetical protein ACJ741_15405 [Pyrinomonadaceae bacterium]
MSRQVGLKERRHQTAMEAARRWQETAAGRVEVEKALAACGSAATDPALAEAFRMREGLRFVRTMSARIDAVDGAERAIGGLNWADLPLDDLAVAAGNPVARIIEIPDSDDFDPEGFGTGLAVGVLSSSSNRYRRCNTRTEPLRFSLELSMGT